MVSPSVEGITPPYKKKNYYNREMPNAPYQFFLHGVNCEVQGMYQQRVFVRWSETS